jgi:hypothetical protein
MNSELAARGKSMRWVKQQLRAQLGGGGRPPSHELMATGAGPRGTGGEGTADNTGGEDTADATGFDGAVARGASVTAVSPDGGFVWACGGEDASDAWISRPDVRAVLHLRAAGRSSFHYRNSGPAFVMLWPFLSTKVRSREGEAPIYNGGG